MDTEALCRTIQRAFALMGLPESRIDTFAERLAYLTLLERLAPDDWLVAIEGAAAPNRLRRVDMDAELAPSGCRADWAAIGPWEPCGIARSNAQFYVLYRRPLRKKP